MNPDPQESDSEPESLRQTVWRIIFRHNTPGSKAFDVVLLILIGLSVAVIMLESVGSLGGRYRAEFFLIELGFTLLFTIEYLVRIAVVRNRRKYICSFFGIVDLISILPTYLALVFAGTQYLVVIRILRLLRMFRVLKMARYIGESNVLLNALKASRAKIAVFLFSVLAVTAVLGTLMYLVEGVLYGNEDYANIPQSVYWTIITISTVGYGDVTPITPLGKLITTITVLIGYGIIAVPTGIVTAELNMTMKAIQPDSRTCGNCNHTGHDQKAAYCKMCGDPL